MSTDAAFSPLSFPAVASRHDGDHPARTRGHAAGYAAGLRLAEEELREQLALLAEEHATAVATATARIDRLAALLEAAVRSVEASVVPVLADAQHSLAHAVIELAEVVVGCELADGETSARAAVTRALDGVDPALVLTVRLHPDTLADLDDAAIVPGITYTADASLEPGDAVTDFAEGYLDARISSALARAREALLGGAE
jgi:flagellar assembly protein FliH